MFISKISKSKIAGLTDFRKSKEYVTYVKKTINTEFLRIKKQMISTFNNHPVTVEINAGPTASNTSGTLSGVGNLYSYIGFDKGSKPTIPIVQKLEKETFLSSVVFSKNGTFRVVVNNPTANDIFDITPLPWAQGRSWAEGIERGLPGFGLYLNEQSSFSRSGSGIQVKNKLRSGKFKNVPYISKIIKDFEMQIVQLNNQSF